MRLGTTLDGAAVGLCAITLCCAVLAISLGSTSVPGPSRASGSQPIFEPAVAFIAQGSSISIRSSGGGDLWWSDKSGAADPQRAGDRVSTTAFPDKRAAAHTIATPTAMQWRHPLPGLPVALVLRASEVDELGSAGPWSMHTYVFTDHGHLPILSISARSEALFSVDSGICVVGDGLLRADEPVLRSYALDPKWWKYPGNYHGRGKEWEREARVQLIDPDGAEVFQTEVALRVNGQMTRGFPQHALRLGFSEPLQVPLFADGDGPGTTSLVLRAAGNDQVKAMLRDAYQHGLCAGQPFDISRALPCVVYINGAYWGVHHLRQRMDAEELARRYGIPVKRITVLEDQAELYRGDSAQVRDFMRLVIATERWNGQGPAWIDSLEKRIDLDGYLVYMASQMILGNMDWPRQNVKYWRYTGAPKKTGPKDGRWYFVMGDSDLSFGANTPPSGDMFARVRLKNAPISRLFMAMMRSPVLRERFVAHARGLVGGALSPERCSARLEEIIALLAPEMQRHTARWRKPLNEKAWWAEIEIMRAYARERGSQVLEQLKTFTAE